MFKVLLVFLALFMSACSGTNPVDISVNYSSKVTSSGLKPEVRVNFGLTKVWIRKSITEPGAFDVQNESWSDIRESRKIYLGESESSFIPHTQKSWQTVKALSNSMVFKVAYIKVVEEEVIMVCQLFLPPDDGRGSGFIVHCNK